VTRGRIWSLLKAPTLLKIPGQSGAQRENRTLDLFITSEMLYRLSYLGDAEMLAGRDLRAHGEFEEIPSQADGQSVGVASLVPGR
jgi:hypothetical protein